LSGALALVQRQRGEDDFGAFAQGQDSHGWGG
jgi:hypothetical protein